MIFDSHMHVGDFPLFNVSLDRDELEALMREHETGEGVDRVGPSRVLYGSDAPFHHPAVEIAKVRLSGLEPDLVDPVLGANGRALFLGDEGRHHPPGVNPPAEEVGPGRLAP